MASDKDKNNCSLQRQDHDHDQEHRMIKNLKKRVKKLLKEPENQRCSECYKKHKPIKFMTILKAPIDDSGGNGGNGELGIFCCKDCHWFHLALGKDYCTVKSLKDPQEWTEQDVATLERSGNKAVNAIYLSSLAGNHTDKHVGSLASADYVESKYKHRLYFTEKAYHEQIQLRAEIRSAKAGKSAKDAKSVKAGKSVKSVKSAKKGKKKSKADSEQPTTTDDKLRNALKRQKSIEEGTTTTTTTTTTIQPVPVPVPVPRISARLSQRLPDKEEQEEQDANNATTTTTTTTTNNHHGQRTRSKSTTASGLEDTKGSAHRPTNRQCRRVGLRRAASVRDAHAAESRTIVRNSCRSRHSQRSPPPSLARSSTDPTRRRRTQSFNNRSPPPTLPPAPKRGSHGSRRSTTSTTSTTSRSTSPIQRESNHSPRGSTSKSPTKRGSGSGSNCSSPSRQRNSSHSPQRRSATNVRSMSKPGPKLDDYNLDDSDSSLSLSESDVESLFDDDSSFGSSSSSSTCSNSGSNHTSDDADNFDGDVDIETRSTNVDIVAAALALQQVKAKAKVSIAPSQKPYQRIQAIPDVVLSAAEKEIDLLALTSNKVASEDHSTTDSSCPPPPPTPARQSFEKRQMMVDAIGCGGHAIVQKIKTKMELPVSTVEKVIGSPTETPQCELSKVRESLVDILRTGQNHHTSTTTMIKHGHDKSTTSFMSIDDTVLVDG